jgi:hypothetical protein
VKGLAASVRRPARRLRGLLAASLLLGLVTSAGAAGLARAEGGADARALLEDVKNDPAKAHDRATLDALEKDLGSLPDPARPAARLVLAEAWRSLDDSARATPLLEQTLADPSADEATRALAMNDLVAIDRELGRLTAARAAVQRYPDLTPDLRDDVIREARRETLSAVCLGFVGLLAVAALVALVRVARGRSARALRTAVVRPLPIVAALGLGGVTALLARLDGDRDPRAFLALGLGVAAMDVIARALRLGWPRGGRIARVVRALACVAGVVAIAFLAASRTDPAYLEGLGL